ncbi:MAG: hypothetical protein ACOY81_00050 [Bacillota bacterium]
MRLLRYFSWPGRTWLVGRRPGDDRRSVVARQVDNLIGLLFLWLALYLALSWYFGQQKFFWPIFIAMAALSSGVVRKWRLGQKELVRQRKRAWQAAQDFRQELGRAVSSGEMAGVVRRLLLALPGAQEAEEFALPEQRVPTGQEQSLPGDLALFRVNMNGQTVLVGCVIPDQSQPDNSFSAAVPELTARQAQECLKTLHKAGYPKVVLAVAGRVSEEALLVGRRWRRRLGIYWLDLEQMARLAGWLSLSGSGSNKECAPAVANSDLISGPPCGRRSAFYLFSWQRGKGFLRVALWLILFAILVGADWRNLYLGASLFNAFLACYSYYLHKTAGQWGLPR